MKNVDPAAHHSIGPLSIAEALREVAHEFEHAAAEKTKLSEKPGQGGTAVAEARTETVTTSSSDCTKRAQASISIGTEVRHRASIDPERWKMLEAVAIKRGREPAAVLRELIETAFGRERSRRRTAVELRGLDLLCEHVIQDLVRYDAALCALTQNENPPASSMVEAEANDYRDALVRVVMTANWRLMNEVILIRKQLCEFLSKKKKPC